MRLALIIVLLAAHCAVGQVERVGIVGAEPALAHEVAQAEKSGGAPVALLLGAVAVLMAAGVCNWWAWRRWSRLDDAERAFLLLSLRRGVRHKERQRLRKEAREKGVSPVAVLLIGQR